ncbi:MAG TPA: GDSL-type esterase/lipase family protein, partial [Burkholderiaceae bacterium]
MAKPTKVLVVGDSLSAEYGIARGSGWVALMEQRLQKAFVGATVVNASISGDTSSGGRTRMPVLLTEH